MGKVIVFCGALLLCVCGMSDSNREQIGSDGVFINPDGGKYFHCTSQCSSVAREYQDKMKEYDTPEGVNGIMDRYRPCPVCYGEKDEAFNL